MHCKTIKVLAYFMLSFFITSCNHSEYLPPVKSALGYSPVYAMADDYKIELIAAQPVQKTGKIYIYKDYLLVNEQQKGIHFFNNSNPSAPTPLGFLKIRGNVDIAIRNNVLYVDHIGSLVALNITDLNQVVELSRIKSWDVNNVPPGSYYRYFKCVDPEKGEVIGWDVVMLENPQCYK